MKETVQEAAKEMCEAWGMEDNHGYSVKDTFQVGFVQGSNWRAEQSPWISVEDKLPDTDNGQSLFNVIIKFDDGSYYIVANIDVEDMAKAGGATHWMPIPE